MGERSFPSAKGTKKQNNLDKCLDSIFTNRLCFQIGNEEERFIQTAIESLVRKLVEAIERFGIEEKKDVIRKFLYKNQEFRLVCDGKKILKAGSFYENTKNVYPDEFDYIYVICTLQVLEDNEEEYTWFKHYFTLNEFHDTIRHILTKTIDSDEYVYRNQENEGRFIVFDGYNRKQGPSSNVSFRYIINETQNSNEITIDVDIVPAFRVIDNRLPDRIRNVCNVEGFAEIIASRRSYFITNEVSFTGSEGRFMREWLSKSHKKAYRLLKHIFNGSSDGEKLRQWVPKTGISTYMIKVAMIHHHFACTLGDSVHTKPSTCVITMLKDILQYCIDYNNMDDPMLKKFHGGNFEMQLDNVEQTIDGIEKMLTKLMLLKENTIMTRKIKSISESILDYIQLQSSTGHISGNSSRRNSISSCKSVRFSRSLKSVAGIEISLDYAHEETPAKQIKDQSQRSYLSRAKSIEHVGITANTHEHTVKPYRYSERERRRVHSQTTSSPTTQVVDFDDTNFKTNRDMSRKKKSRTCTKCTLL